MMQMKWIVGGLAALLLAGCGGSGNNEQEVAFERVGDGFRQIPVDEARARTAAPSITPTGNTAVSSAAAQQPGASWP